MELLTCGSDELDAGMVEQLRTLWWTAFPDFTEDDAEHAFGGVHVIALDDGRVLSHASAVERTILVGDVPFVTGYVEAVSTWPDRHGRGLGTAVMTALEAELRRRWTFGALATDSHPFYERLGWERWQGPSYVLTDRGRVRSEDEDEGIMVLRFGPSADVDLTLPITCPDRPGDAW